MRELWLCLHPLQIHFVCCLGGRGGAGWFLEFRKLLLCGLSDLRSGKPKATGAGHWRAKPSEDAWTRSEVLALMPPDAPLLVFRGPAQGHWEVVYKRVGRRKISWQERGGETEAVKEAARQAWEWHQTATLVLCTKEHCPVPGLFS